MVLGPNSERLVSRIFLLSIYVLEIEREQKKELRDNERELDRQLRTLTLQEQKLVHPKKL